MVRAGGCKVVAPVARATPGKNDRDEVASSSAVPGDLSCSGGARTFAFPSTERQASAPRSPRLPKPRALARVGRKVVRGHEARRLKSREAQTQRNAGNATPVGSALRHPGTGSRVAIHFRLHVRAPRAWQLDPTYAAVGAMLCCDQQKVGDRGARPGLAEMARIRRRVGAELEPLLARLSGRRAELGLALALAVFFMIVGRLSPYVALSGLAAAAAWAMLRPSEAVDRYARAGASGQSGAEADRLWRMVVDAVPEPTVVLDHSGTVLHANRMAEDLFGARRRGGHVAAMSRDPELLGAVDQALVSGATCSVELQERVPVERRLPATVGQLAGTGPRDSQRCSSPCVTRRSRTGWRTCVPTSSPTPVTSCARRSPRCAASSRRCRERRGRREGARTLPQVMGEQADAHDAADRRSSVAEPRRDARASVARRRRRSQRGCGHVIQSARSRWRTRPASRIEFRRLRSAHRARRPRRDRAGVPEPGAERHQVRQGRRAHRASALRTSRPSAADPPASSP